MKQKITELVKKVSYKKLTYFIAIILFIINSGLLIRFLLMHESDRISGMLGALFSVLELLVLVISLLNELNKMPKLPIISPKCRKIIPIILIIINLGLMFLWLIPHTKSPCIYSIDVCYMDAKEDCSIYQVKVETTLSVNTIVIQVDNVDKQEIARYTEKVGKRCFSAIVELNHEKTTHDITAYILTIEGKKIETDIMKNIELSEREDEQMTEEIKGESSEEQAELLEEDTEEDEIEDSETEVIINTEVKEDVRNPLLTQQEGEREHLGSAGGGRKEPQPSNTEVETNSEKEDNIESDSENSELENSETKETATMTVSYERYFVPLTDADATVYAVTSINAECVTLKGKKGTKEYDVIYMKTKDSLHWYSDIDFTEAGTFVITITAYFVDGQTITEQIEIIYPYY